MNKKLCPFLVLANTIGSGWPTTFCEEIKCALWNDHLGCCGLVAIGMVQGIEIARQEMRADRETDRGEHFMDADGRPCGYEDEQHAAEMAMEPEPDYPF